MRTLEELITTHGVDVDPHLDRQASVPVIAGLQRQGDVLVVPAFLLQRAEKVSRQVPRDGVPVVRGEAGGNTHLLLGDGPVFWAAAPRRDGSLTLGSLMVPDGSTAYLAHPEHAYAGIGPGTYELRRQREQADEVRLVSD